MATDALSPVSERRNRNVAVGLFFLAAGMVGAAYAAVPLYQLIAAGLPAQFPPLRVTAEVPGNLPVELSTIRLVSDQ